MFVEGLFQSLEVVTDHKEQVLRMASKSDWTQIAKVSSIDECDSRKQILRHSYTENTTESPGKDS